MKRALIISLVVLIIAVAVFSLAAEKSKLSLKAGVERWVCNWGETCACNTISMNPGKYTCGSEMKRI